MGVLLSSPNNVVSQSRRPRDGRRGRSSPLDKKMFAPSTTNTPDNVATSRIDGWKWASSGTEETFHSSPVSNSCGVSISHLRRDTVTQEDRLDEVKELFGDDENHHQCLMRSNVSKAIAIPCPPRSRAKLRHDREIAEYSEMCKLCTWRMYHRISSSRHTPLSEQAFPQLASDVGAAPELLNEAETHSTPCSECIDYSSEIFDMEL